MDSNPNTGEFDYKTLDGGMATSYGRGYNKSFYSERTGFIWKLCLSAFHLDETNSVVWSRNTVVMCSDSPQA